LCVRRYGPFSGNNATLVDRIDNSRAQQFIATEADAVGHMCVRWRIYVPFLGHICVAKKMLRKNYGATRENRNASGVIDSSVYHLCSARIGRVVG
jgi:hypothetical protein